MRNNCCPFLNTNFFFLLLHIPSITITSPSTSSLWIIVSIFFFNHTAPPKKCFSVQIRPRTSLIHFTHAIFARFFFCLFLLNGNKSQLMTMDFVCGCCRVLLEFTLNTWPNILKSVITEIPWNSLLRLTYIFKISCWAFQGQGFDVPRILIVTLTYMSQIRNSSESYRSWLTQ
jgi:hypothetical protein